MSRRPLRCAIYTRVSTEHGLEQEFNSLDNQREAAEAYVKSQAHEGWRLLRDRYDDGGFSGGSMERPALQRLLEQVRQRRIDVIVVYKVDRLTRSLADFAKLVELFDANGVSFVSVTQAFNTTTSMGRLTLNVLLSFAQFEREVTGERIRDKIAASKKKGMWMGGVVPLGYRVEARALHVVDEHAAIVRQLFARYFELGSVSALKAELDRTDVTVPVREDGAGRRSGGERFSRGHLYGLLANPLYAGLVHHRGELHPGQHQAIVDRGNWDNVQKRIASRTYEHRRRTAAPDHLLTGRIRDMAGRPMSPTHSQKGSLRYRYYVSAALQQGRKAEAGSVVRIPAREIEQAVLGALRTQARGTPRDLPDAELIEAMLHHVIVRPDLLELALADDELLQVTWSHSPSRRRREIIGATSNPAPSSIRPMKVEDRARILSALSRARRWLDELTSGQIANLRAIATREATSERAVRTILMLAFVSPAIVTAIVEGRLPRGIGIARLAALPPAWPEQQQALGL